MGLGGIWPVTLCSCSTSTRFLLWKRKVTLHTSLRHTIRSNGCESGHKEVLWVARYFQGASKRSYESMGNHSNGVATLSPRTTILSSLLPCSVVGRDFLTMIMPGLPSHPQIWWCHTNQIGRMLICLVSCFVTWRTFGTQSRFSQWNTTGFITVFGCGNIIWSNGAAQSNNSRCSNCIHHWSMYWSSSQKSNC